MFEFPSSFAEEIYERKYAGDYADNPTGYYEHLADLVSISDKRLAESFRGLLTSHKFSPGGRILAFAGRPSASVSLMNCTTHQISEDTLESISDTMYTIMRASSRGQGIGVDLTNLRPRGAAVNNAAKTSTGAVSFMELLNNVGGTIGQDGRRAAMLFSMRVDHPDLWRKGEQDVTCPTCNGNGCIRCNGKGKIPYDFLHIKTIPGRVENANISVLITDEFMQAVKEKRNWELVFNGESNGESFHVKTTMPAEELFRELASAAWRSAEPGVLFLDTIRRMSNSDVFGKPWEVVGCNACQPEFATVLTPDGIKKLGDIDVGDLIMGAEGWVTVVNKWSNGVKPVYRFSCSNGEFIGTEDHKVYESGSKVQAKDAQYIDSLVPIIDVFDGDDDLDPQDVMDGFALFEALTFDISPRVHLAKGDEEDILASEIGGLLKTFLPEVSAREGMRVYEVETTIRPEELNARRIPDRFYHGSAKKKAGFLRGAFSSLGVAVPATNGHGNAYFMHTHETAMRQLQEMLSSIGIESFVYYDYEDARDPDANVSYLRVSQDSTRAFMTRVGFLQTYKMDAMVQRQTYKAPVADSYSALQRTAYLGRMEVYDITVDSPSHTYWTGGLMVSNCSEMMLDQDGVCNLGSINLGKYVTDPFTPEASFDFSAFSHDVALAIEFLDNVLTLELADDRSISTTQIRSIQWLRRVGLGVMGLADALAMLGLPYQSSGVSGGFMREVFKTMRDSAYLASINLARENGPCVAWKTLNEERRRSVVESGFYATLPEDIKELIVTYGLRNVTLLSIAPTGSISNLCGASSGIEPLFALEYVRRVRMHGEDSFITYVHPGVVQSRAAGAPDSVWQVAYDVTPEEHVRVQALIQEYIDSAIAKTVNMPESATIQDVANIYMLAWELGLKGTAVYRDNSRSEAVLYANKTEDEVAGNRAAEEVCPACGASVIKHGGCTECPSCGWGKCGG